MIPFALYALDGGIQVKSYYRRAEVCKKPCGFQDDPKTKPFRFSIILIYMISTFLPRYPRVRAQPRTHARDRRGVE